MNKTCEVCDGSGQISFFKGVSRFLISWEECPACGGLGFIPEQDGRIQEKEGEESPNFIKKQKKPTG